MGVVIEVVPFAELDALWAANEVDRKRASGMFLESSVDRTAVRNPRWLGGEARIAKLITANGQHIGAVHEVLMTAGDVVHSHPKDYTRRDCSRVRSA